MNQAQIAQIVAAVVSAIAPQNTRKPALKVRKYRSFDTSKLSAAVVDDKTEKQLNRYAAVARGFHRKGLKTSQFTLAPGGTDTVKTYKGWLANGRQVIRGQHGVKGLFHISQTEILQVNREPVTVPVGQQALQA